jgi:outer membrane protein insertion porin family
MMKRRNISAITLFFIVLLFSGCTGLRKIPQGEYLYSGSTFSFDSAQLLSNQKVALNEIDGLLKSPNTKMLWMRPFLSIHNMVKEPKKEKGLKYWLKYKLGEPPVLMSSIDSVTVNTAIRNRLENLGHFSAASDFEIHRKKRTAAIHYSISPGVPYTINRINYPSGQTPLQKQIGAMKAESLLNTGDYYNLSVFKEERHRIENILKNSGYFYFTSDHLLFNADSTAGNRRIELQLRVKPDAPALARMPFKINNIYVFDDFSLQSYRPDTTIINGYYYVSANRYFHPETILDAVFLQPDSIYSRLDHFNTLSYLMGLGVYKFANARFFVRDSTNGLLDAGIYLTPEKKISLSAELNASVKTNNYSGPGVKLSLKNRNTFKGAELFSMNLGARFESQFSGEYKGETSYEVVLDASLTLPRFVPFNFKRKVSRQFVPQTVFSTGIGLYSRVRFYELHSFNTGLGYNWRSSLKVSHQFKPVDVSFTNLSKSSDEFREYLDNNPTIKRSFEEQFILGASYTIALSNMHKQDRATNYYFSQGFDASGNLAGMAMNLTNAERKGNDEQYNLLGVPFAQFFRLRNETRFFVKLGQKNQLAMRLIAAAAIPYGNSNTIPYVKQFFVGGTSSVRAFRARTVGPGTYAPPDTLSNIFIDQAGDIKLELNFEYRFPLYSFLKGALFADAGNIWLVNEDEQRPGSKFDIKTFYKELAIGVGAGLRFDFTFVVLRLDLAMPLRRPYLVDGSQWVVNDIDPGSPGWRKENMILNIGIGYPF